MGKFARIVLVLVASLWLLKEVVIPASAALVYSNDFMQLVHECDIAMEASWYYRQNDRIDKQSEVVQLLSCHDYDKTRKLMLTSGLSENYLSWLGLKSLELYQRSAEEYVEQHRFIQR